VISSDRGESEGLSPLRSIPFENCCPVWLSRFWTRSAISSLRGTSGLGNAESSERLSSSEVSDRSRLEFLVECADSLSCFGDEGVRALPSALREDYDFHSVSTRLSSRVCVRAAASFLRVAVSWS